MRLQAILLGPGFAAWDQLKRILLCFLNRTRPSQTCAKRSVSSKLSTYATLSPLDIPLQLQRTGVFDLWSTPPKSTNHRPGSSLAHGAPWRWIRMTCEVSLALHTARIVPHQVQCVSQAFLASVFFWHPSSTFSKPSHPSGCQAFSPAQRVPQSCQVFLVYLVSTQWQVLPVLLLTSARFPFHDWSSAAFLQTRNTKHPSGLPVFTRPLLAHGESSRHSTRLLEAAGPLSSTPPILPLQRPCLLNCIFCR